MAIAANLGFPRIGADRELKKALEAYWKGSISEDVMMCTANGVRAERWQLQEKAGIEHIPSNDFSLYDHVLDTIALVGAVPARYNWKGGNVDLKTYFAMARGSQKDGLDVTAMDMTKWFDTNYHYIVPEFTADQEFSLASSKPVDEFNAAKELGIKTRPVLLGPVSFLLLGKMKGEGDALSLLPKLLPVYAQVLKNLEEAGAEWVQIDEPCLVLDLSADARKAYGEAYNTLAESTKLNIMLTTYFGDLRDNLSVAAKLPVAGLHVDLVRAPGQLDDVIKAWPKGKLLSLGVIDGRNIWKADLTVALAILEATRAVRGADEIVVAPSCSLLHTPVDLDKEDKLDNELKNWLAFAKQKLAEIKLLTNAVNGNKNERAFEDNLQVIDNRRSSERIHSPWVKERLSEVDAAMSRRKSPFGERIQKQNDMLGLPLFPTTTIGSFPQTADVREKRASFKAGKITEDQYNQFLMDKTAECIRWQEEVGIDVPVHGEFERNDMVEYFGEQLSGFAFTKNGWVQSYGSRCVKPPIIFGDVSRPEPMTVKWSAYAQNLTEKPVKGMLTGPVTILQWSFVRDDQPRSETCKQIAMAIRDEVQDLEQAGIRLIQIDEPAIREGLPLRKADWKAYLEWAVESFKLSSSGVADTTQIHTHMCYSEFNDIIEAVAAMDADVISIETSRSAMELLDAFVQFKYPNQIGPGVYDIHSPRVPNENEMVALMEKALKVLAAEQLWVNPDCGLKTRGWEETKPALIAMVNAARRLRSASEGTKKKAANG